MKCSRTAWLVSMLALVATAASVEAASVAFDSNAAGAKDLTIYTSTNQNAYTALEVNSPTPSRSLVAFDVSSLAGQYASIDSITLRLTTSYNTTTASIALNLHQVLSDWSETQATINDRFTGTPWGTVGGDFAATVLGSVDLSTLNFSGAFDGVQQQVSISILSGAGNAAARKALIDSWTGGSNFGLLLKSSPEAAGQYAGFRGRSRAAAGDRPLLTVEFTPVPEPTSISLFAFMATALAVVWRRNRGTL